jgi:hypothetical protein
MVVRGTSPFLNQPAAVKRLESLGLTGGNKLVGW